MSNFSVLLVDMLGRQDHRTKPVTERRAKMSLKCYCQCMVTLHCQEGRDAAQDEWFVTALNLAHTPPCVPSHGQRVVQTRKRGILISDEVLRDLILQSYHRCGS